MKNGLAQIQTEKYNQDLEIQKPINGQVVIGHLEMINSNRF